MDETDAGRNDIWEKKKVWVLTAWLKEVDGDGEPLNWGSPSEEYYAGTHEEAVLMKENLLAGKDVYYGDLIEDVWISDEPEEREFLIPSRRDEKKRKEDKGDTEADNQKADKMLHSIEKSYPKENTSISFGNNITYTTDNVKNPRKEDSVAETDKEDEFQRFKADFKLLLNGDKKIASHPLVIGKTPIALGLCDADINLDLTITKKVIDKVMRPELLDENGKKTKNSGHFLTEEQILKALEDMNNPVMILQGSAKGTLVVVTEQKDNRGQAIIIALAINKRGESGEINAITSLYGREKFADYISRNLSSNKVIALNKKKADKMLPSIGVYFPEAMTFISFDNSITSTTDNVKYPQIKNEKESNVMVENNYSGLQNADKGGETGKRRGSMGKGIKKSIQQRPEGYCGAL